MSGGNTLSNLDCIADLTQSLNRKEADCTEFFQNCPEPLCILGPDGTFDRLNNAWEEVLGWSTADLQGTPPLSLVHPEDLTHAESLWNKAVEQGCGWDNGEVIRYRSISGSYRPFSWRLSFDDKGYAYVCARDVTDFLDYDPSFLEGTPLQERE